MKKAFLITSVITCFIIAYSCSTKQRTLAGFELEKGFHLNLVASEPLIKDPVDLEFDEHGNALVLEMPGYPYEDSSSRVMLLKDTNHDGKMDCRQKKSKLENKRKTYF